MIVMVAVDDRNGMLFHGRRQSQDRELRARILERAGGRRLWMNGYSAKQFAGEAEQQLIAVSERFLDEAGPGEYCFVENVALAGHWDRVEGLVVYRWNRAYPGDVFLDVSMEGWTLTGRTEFAGHSHPRITEEVYTR